ncbi:MAG TPA: hypothetical protein VG501_11030 [Rhizomicrobium sp.]|nr:hypothetical protein [Rhizomicrobium sp.]
MQTAADTPERTDKALLHAFMRLCHFVDWRFHINQFDLARDVMGAGLALFGAQSLQDVLRPWKPDAPVVFSVGLAFGLCASSSPRSRPAGPGRDGL